MPLPVIANTFRIVLEWGWNSNEQRALNVFHVETTETNMDTIYDDLDSHVDAAMWRVQSNNSGVQTVHITPLDGTSATSSYVTGGPPRWSGEAGGDPIIQAANLVKLRTGERGRSKRGRLYLPFVAEGSTAAGFISSTDALGIQAAWRTFAANLEALTPAVNMVVASYKLATATLVTAIDGETALGTMRRRQQRNRRV